MFVPVFLTNLSFVCCSVSSSGRLPWTVRASHTSWSTRYCVDLHVIPAETLFLRCLTGPCPRSWMPSQVRNEEENVPNVCVSKSVLLNVADVSFVCLSSQWLHTLPLLHTKRERLPESAVGLSGCSFLPLFARAGFQVRWRSHVAWRVLYHCFILLFCFFWFVQSGRLEAGERKPVWSQQPSRF